MVPAPIELKRGRGSSTTDRKICSTDRGGRGRGSSTTDRKICSTDRGSSALSRSDISAGVFIPWRGGTDESGAAKFLLDLLGPPDGEVAAACRCRFLFSDYDWRWRSGGGVMVPAPARGRGSNWRRPDRDNWAVARQRSTLSLPSRARTRRADSREL